MASAWDQYPGSGSMLLVLLALADWSDDDGRCYPSMSAIARKARLSRSQAQRVVHQLIDEGVVTVTENQAGGAPGATPRYRILTARMTGRTDATGRGGATGRAGVTCRAGATGRIHAQDGSHGCEDTGSAGATQTVSEPSTTVNDMADKPPVVSEAADSCPYQQIVAAYHEHFPSGRRVTVLSEKRKKAIRARWREVRQGEYRPAGDPREPRESAKALRFFGRYFAYCESVDWCAGRKAMGKDQGFFRATIDNLMGADFMAKRSDEAHDPREAA